MIARVRRFGRNTGRMGVAQLLAAVAVLGWVVATGPAILKVIVGGAVVAGLVLMWLARPLLLHKPSATARVLNGFAFLVVGVLVVSMSGAAQVPWWAWLGVLVMVPFQLWANFWMYSDEHMITSHALRSMMRRAPSTYGLVEPAEGAGLGEPGERL